MYKKIEMVRTKYNIDRMLLHRNKKIETKKVKTIKKKNVKSIKNLNVIKIYGNKAYLIEWKNDRKCVRLRDFY